MDGEGDNQNENLILKKENEQKIPKVKSCYQRIWDKFSNVGIEIWFALTFIGRIIMTLYSFHGLFFIYNFIIQFILLIPSRLYDLDSLAWQIIFGIFYVLFSMAASNVLVIPTYEFFLFPFLNFTNPLAHFHSLLRVKSVMDYEDNKFKKKKIYDEEEERNFEQKNMPIINFLLIVIEIFYVTGLVISLLYDTKLKDYAKLVILSIIYTYYSVIVIGYVLLCFYIIIKLFCFSCNTNKGCVNIFLGSFDLNAYFGDPEQKMLKINIDSLEEIFEDEIKEEKVEEEKKEEEKKEEEIKVVEKEGEKNKKDKKKEENDKKEIPQKEERDIPPLPRLNLLSYVIHPLLMKSYKLVERNINTEKRNCEDKCLFCKNTFRFILFIYALFLVFFDLSNNKSSIDALPLFAFLIFFLLMLITSLVLNFSICFRNKKTFGIGGFFTGKVKMKKIYKLRHPRLVSFIRFICNAIVTLASIILFALFYVMKDSNTLQELYDATLNTKKSLVDTTTLLLPNVCFSSVHHIPIYLFMPFINDAYYYDDKSKDYEHYYHSSLQIPSYRDFFFDDTYKIDEIKSLINGTDGETVKMIQYNVRKRTDKENYITILSIKGTTNKKDAFIDFQLYFPSILLNLLSTFSIQGQQKETYSFKFIEYSLSIPYRIFFQYSLVQSYLEALKKAYFDNYDSFYKNIIIVGHSLGGGLAKLLGRLLNKQAISLSGPGVNAFHSLWGYEGNSENFELSAIDLVPDKDLVPRVEISGGTRYRIICKDGPFACHSKALSLCEVLIMCRNPNYYTYCSEIAELSDEKIKDLYESSEMNFNFEG